MNFLTVGRALGLLLVCLLCTHRAAAKTLPTRPGVWCEREAAGTVSAAHEQRLVQSLIRITGLCELHFTPDGELCLGDFKNTSGGSDAARQMLVSVFASRLAFVIEDCSRSDAVTFGQVTQDAIYEDSQGHRLDVWLVRMDFADFQQVQAPAEVRDSFDEGFILLHELLHGLGYTDASHEEELGHCEDMVNRARDELGLPLRDQYFVAPVRVADKLLSARIRFRRSRGATAEKPEARYLYFLLRPDARYKIGARSATERRR